MLVQHTAASATPTPTPASTPAATPTSDGSAQPSGMPGAGESPRPSPSAGTGGGARIGGGSGGGGSIRIPSGKTGATETKQPAYTVAKQTFCAVTPQEKMLITGDLEIQLERQGQARELGYFSAGQVDAVMLCMRFALVDALFTEEKPFVILDDPFVNLDDAHTAQALELLQKLAQDRQIIYLVCNSSRTI